MTSFDDLDKYEDASIKQKVLKYAKTFKILI